jgi:hypothetical protein
MTAFRFAVWSAAAAVLGICVYVFFTGSFQGGRWKDDLLCWYFLAKGIFCSVSLVLTGRMVELLSRLGNPTRLPEAPHDELWHQSQPVKHQDENKVKERGAL